MGWNQQSHFYCEVSSARKHVEKICSDARRGLHITAAGELGAIELILRAKEMECTETVGPRGGIHRAYRQNDIFEVWFRPWRSCENPSAQHVMIASGPLDYDRVQHEEAMVRFDDKAMELYRTLRAMEVMQRR